MPFDSKYMTSYPMAIVMFSLSLTIYMMCANQEKYQKMKVKVKE